MAKAEIRLMALRYVGIAARKRSDTSAGFADMATKRPE